LQADTRVLLVAGKPLDEPIATYGPFVLSNKAQLQQAFDDFKTGKNGFE
jgi:redox-sensitive bicupin YhaK (pirin superfamily)